MHGTATWALIFQNVGNLQNIRSMEKTTLGIILRVMITMEWIKKQTKMEDIAETTYKSKWRWEDLKARMSEWHTKQQYGKSGEKLGSTISKIVRRYLKYSSPKSDGSCSGARKMARRRIYASAWEALFKEEERRVKSTSLVTTFFWTLEKIISCRKNCLPKFEGTYFKVGLNIHY